MKEGQPVTNTNGRKGSVKAMHPDGAVEVHTSDNDQTRYYTAAQAKRFLKS